MQPDNSAPTDPPLEEPDAPGGVPTPIDKPEDELISETAQIAVAMSVFANETAELTDEETKREPCNYEEAMNSPDCDLWEDAMWSEFCKVTAAGTYNLVDLPAGFKALGSTWAFRIKQDETHAITEYKAHICIQGFTQVPGINFSDMYAPTSKIEVVCLLLSIAAIHDWEFHIVDVNSAFLNSELPCDQPAMYMKQPEGFVVEGQENKVWELLKALYDLK